MGFLFVAVSFVYVGAVFGVRTDDLVPLQFGKRFSYRYAAYRKLLHQFGFGRQAVVRVLYAEVDFLKKVVLNFLVKFLFHFLPFKLLFVFEITEDKNAFFIYLC